MAAGLAMYFMNGTIPTSGASPGLIPTTWTIAATGDFNADGKSNLLWRDNSGTTASG